MSADTRLANLPVAKVRLSETNPRKSFPEEEEAELVASVAQHGIVQPIVVREVGEFFVIVAGERRFRAAIKLQLSHVPAVIRELTDLEALEIAVLENLQRKDVPALEEADGFRALIERGAYTVDTLAQRLGKSRALVYQRLSLLDLAPEFYEAVGQGFIPASVASLAASKPPEEQRQILKEALISTDGAKVSARQFKAVLESRAKALQDAQQAEAAQWEAQRKDREQKWKLVEKQREAEKIKRGKELRKQWRETVAKLTPKLKRLDPWEIVRRCLAGAHFQAVENFKLSPTDRNDVLESFGDLLEPKPKKAGRTAKPAKARHDVEQFELEAVK